jgi:hypothetical protein
VVAVVVHIGVQLDLSVGLLVLLVVPEEEVGQVIQVDLVDLVDLLLELLVEHPIALLPHQDGEMLVVLVVFHMLHPMQVPAVEVRVVLVLLDQHLLGMVEMVFHILLQE